MDNGRTPAFAAAQQGQVGCLRLLASMGSDFSRGNNTGVTPLQIALAGGHTEAVEFLKETAHKE